jgi:hypothetical protein
MRLPSLVVLANQSRELLLRFPCTMGAGVLVVLPLTFGLTLLGEDWRQSPFWDSPNEEPSGSITGGSS